MKNIALALAMAIGIFAATELLAQDYGYAPQNRLFQNQYTQGGASQYNAAMYQAPLPVPSRVGHTYYTYEALYPHEHLYTHKRRYYNYYACPDAFYGDPCQKRATGGGGLNRTTVIWQSGNLHYGNFPFSLTALQRAQYNLLRKRYCLGASCGNLRNNAATGTCGGGNCGNGVRY